MKRWQYILLACVVVVTLIVMKLPARTASSFKLAISSLFLPLFGLSTTGQNASDRVGNVVIPKREVLRQNEQLRRENGELRVQLQRQAEFERENERLRTMLGYQKTAQWKLRAARVIARDPANWWRNVRLDLGRRDGMVPDLPVLTAEGLVGRISEVSENFSRVVLIGDANCRVAAMVLDAQTVAGARGRGMETATITVDTGVITSGASVLDENIVELNYLSKGSAVKPGQWVRTSGIGGIFPKGITIGQVIDTRPVEFGLYPVARVKLAVKLNLIEEVWVVVP